MTWCGVCPEQVEMLPHTYRHALPEGSPENGATAANDPCSGSGAVRPGEAA